MASMAAGEAGGASAYRAAPRGMATGVGTSAGRPARGSARAAMLAPLCARTFNWNTEAARINNEPGLYALQPAIFAYDFGGSASGQVLRNNFQAKNFPGMTNNAIAQVVQPKSFTTNNLEVTGRFGETQFYASGSWTQQGGAFRFRNGYSRWTTRLNVDQRLGTKWSVGVRTYYAHSNEDGANSENGGQAFFRLTRKFPRREHAPLSHDEELFI